MKTAVFFLVNCVLLYVRSAPIYSEMVWLKDVTTSFETDKRTLSDLDLSDELIFHLSRGSHALILSLKRNYGIDPNADVYVVRKLKNGRSLLEKTHNLEKEDVAYYQDRENGAFMTVRCVKRSNGQCYRVINGNIQIGGRNYDLRPVETDVTARNVLGVPDHRGTRYVLRDQANIQREMSVQNKDAANVNEKNIEQELIDLLWRSPHEQDKRHHFLPTNSTLSSRNVAGLHNREITEKENKQVYNVEIAVLLDSGIWELFSTLQVETNYAHAEDVSTESKIREAYSHIINGVSLRYKEIEDPSIEIHITLRAFFIFKTQQEIERKRPLVKIVDGKKYINADKYLSLISYWDKNVGSKSEVRYDHAMLFTRFDLYTVQVSRNAIMGLCEREGICDLGKRTSVVESSDYFFMETTATHELGHNLGAWHDGEGDAQNCKAVDFFIMTPDVIRFDPAMPYTSNPWIFSKCSVQSFKSTLEKKKCLSKEGVFFNEKEWKNYMMKQPGEVYTPNQQCELINGANSTLCGGVYADICRFMKCMDPKSNKCLAEYSSAARGTNCGTNKWCQKGRCVSKDSK